MSKIIALMPTRGLIFTKSEVALEQEMLVNNQLPWILRTDNQPIPDCRNILVESALKTPATHFLLVDDDVIIPEGGLKTMIDADEDIVFIDYPMHYDDGRWANMGTATYDEWLPGDDYKDKPVAWAGLGCALIKREVFEKLGKPWFARYQKAFVRGDKGKMNFKEGKDVEMGGGGEDTYFFLRAREAGFTIKPIHDMTCGHARLLRVVTTFSEGKYQKQHKIVVNNKIDKPYR